MHLTAKGVQNRPPQVVPLWHVNCFELKAVETLSALIENIYLFLKEFKFGVLPIIRFIARYSFDPSLGRENFYLLNICSYHHANDFPPL